MAVVAVICEPVSTYLPQLTANFCDFRGLKAGGFGIFARHISALRHHGVENYQRIPERVTGISTRLTGAFPDGSGIAPPGISGTPSRTLPFCAPCEPAHRRPRRRVDKEFPPVPSAGPLQRPRTAWYKRSRLAALPRSGLAAGARTSERQSDPPEVTAARVIARSRARHGTSQ